MHLYDFTSYQTIQYLCILKEWKQGVSGFGSEVVRCSRPAFFGCIEVDVVVGDTENAAGRICPDTLRQHN